LPHQSVLAIQLHHFSVDQTVFSVANLTDTSDEMEFRLSKSPEERWEAAEAFRQIAYG